MVYQWSHNLGRIEALQVELALKSILISLEKLAAIGFNSALTGSIGYALYQGCTLYATVQEIKGKLQAELIETHRDAMVVNERLHKLQSQVIEEQREEIEELKSLNGAPAAPHPRSDGRSREPVCRPGGESCGLPEI